ncbi:MAG: hypothetical protein ACSW8C_00320 [bacterium]
MKILLKLLKIYCLFFCTCAFAGPDKKQRQEQPSSVVELPDEASESALKEPNMFYVRMIPPSKQTSSSLSEPYRPRKRQRRKEQPSSVVFDKASESVLSPEWDIVSDRRMIRSNLATSSSLSEPYRPRKRQRRKEQPSSVVELPDEASESALKEANKRLASKNLATIESLKVETPTTEITSFLTARGFATEGKDRETLFIKYSFSKLGIEKAKIEDASVGFLKGLLHCIFNEIQFIITEKIPEKDRILLAEVLKKQVPINSLKIERRGDRMPKEIIACIADALKCNQSLKKLDLSCCKIYNVSGDGPIIELLGDVLRTSCLEILDLSHNSIEYINAIAEALKYNAFLKTLNLSCNNIRMGRSLELLRQALETNNVLQELNLSYNRIGRKGFTSLMEALKRNKDSSLKVLKLLGHRNRITVKTECLNTDLTLETLHLTVNFESYCCTKKEAFEIEPLTIPITEDLFKAQAERTRSLFEEFKEKGDALTIDEARILLERCGIARGVIDAANQAFLLKLMECVLQDKVFTINDLVAQKDLEVLHQALILQVPLRTLMIKNTEKLPEGRRPRQPNVLKAVALALRYNLYLEVLNLNRYCAYCDEIEILGWSLQHNSTLKKLDLSYNNIGNGGLEVLANALKSNRGLETLNLQHNGIKSRGIKALMEALETNKKVKIDLRYNKTITAGRHPNIKFQAPTRAKTPKCSKWFS